MKTQSNQDYSNSEGIVDSALSAAAVAVVVAGIWAIFDKAGSAIQEITSSNDKAEAKKYLNQASQHSANGMFQDAINLLYQCLTKDPENAAAYNELAWIFAINNQYLEEAIGFANKAIGYSTNSVDKACYTDTLAEVYARKGEFDKAISFFLQALDLINNNDKQWPSPSTCHRLAICYSIKQDFPQAFYYLNKSLRGASDNLEAVALLGDICLQSKRYNDAIKYYKQALDLAIANKQLPESYSNFAQSNYLCGIGAAYYYLEEYDKSWSFHSLAMNKFPDNPFPHINLAALSSRKNDKLRMRAFLERGLQQINPNNPQQSTLFEYLLNHMDFENYRDVILEMLLGHGLITQMFYTERVRTWNANQLIKRDQSIQVFNPILTGEARMEIARTKIMKNQNIDLQNANVTASQFGETNTIGSIALGGSIEHPKSDEIKTRLSELQAAINESGLPSYQKRDALNSLNELTKELSKEDSTERQEGVGYYLNKVFELTKAAQPIVEVAKSLGTLLGISL